MATAVDNGVNVGALLEAREALRQGARSGEVQVASHLQVAEGHAQPHPRQRFPRARHGAEAPHRVHVRGGSSRDLRVRGLRRDARRARARGPRELPHRRRRGRRAEPRHPAALGGSEARRLDGHPRHPRHRQRRAQRLRRHQGRRSTSTPTHRRKRSKRSSRSRRSARPCTTSSRIRRT